MALSPTNVADKLYMGRRTRDPIIEGGGGARNVKARVAFLKILWKFFQIVSFIITKIMK